MLVLVALAVVRIQCNHVRRVSQIERRQGRTRGRCQFKRTVESHSHGSRFDVSWGCHDVELTEAQAPPYPRCSEMPSTSRGRLPTPIMQEHPLLSHNGDPLSGRGIDRRR